MDGSVLVFLPGMAMIERVKEALLGDSMFGNVNR